MSVLPACMQVCHTQVVLLDARILKLHFISLFLFLCTHASGGKKTDNVLELILSFCDAGPREQI